MRTGADCSNYSGAPGPAWEQMAGMIDMLAPQALNPPRGYPPGVTRPQVQWSLDHGKLTVPYIWKWFGTGVADIQRRLDLLTPFSGQIDHLALDVEDTSVGVLRGTRRMLVQPPPGALERINRQPPPDRRFLPPAAAATSLSARIDEISQALELCNQFPTKSGLSTAIYTGRWYWTAYMGDTTAFSAYPAWASFYDNLPDYRVWAPYGGWTRLAMKQYAGTSALGGVGGLDLNVLADDYLLPLLLVGPGVNVGIAPGLASQPDPTRLLAYGFKWIRLVSAQSNAEYIARALAAGLDVLPVVTGQSGGWVPPGVRTIQFGNESDVEGGPASWPPGGQSEYVRLGNQYQGTYPEYAWISAGMASGIPDWWAGVAPQLNSCAAVAVHPYAKGANDAMALLDQYGAISPRVVVTEWNRPLAEVTGFAGKLPAHAQAHAWAHWSDDQTVQTEHVRMGLVDEFGKPKPELAALATAIGGDPGGGERPPPTPTIDQAWLDKKAQVVQWAGELGQLADQMDAAADQMKTISAGVRDRAERILA